MIGTIPGTDVHWGLVFGIVAAIVVLRPDRLTTFGFAVRVVGGNSAPRSMVGLAVGR